MPLLAAGARGIIVVEVEHERVLARVFRCGHRGRPRRARRRLRHRPACCRRHGRNRPPALVGRRHPHLDDHRCRADRRRHPLRRGGLHHPRRQGVGEVPGRGPFWYKALAFPKEFPMVFAAGLTDVNFALSFWTAITFAILIVVLGKFAWGPILQMIETREKTIADAIESARTERSAAEAAAAEMRVSLEKARAESAELIRRNQQEVAAAKSELMAQARKESEDLLAQARKTIAEEKRQAMAELRAQTVDIAIEAARRLIEVNLDDKKQKQLVEEYLSQLPRET